MMRNELHGRDKTLRQRVKGTDAERPLQPQHTPKNKRDAVPKRISPAAVLRKMPNNEGGKPKPESEPEPTCALGSNEPRRISGVRRLNERVWQHRRELERMRKEPLQNENAQLEA